ncbi:beta strand repeat-containing protein [Shewanella colwelliana]|uniref:beta strand repeat-containing protein n=1 Tax=Shewanella colwelliana TaxID=23 RepID=UPI0022B0119F|nr:hypothetical protein [Shewanella colwelliana]MCZ4337754.1 hypothetical protein [Shewanella colwelliana]
MQGKILLSSVSAALIVSGGVVHQQGAETALQADLAAGYISQLGKAAESYFDKNGAWPSSASQLQAQLNANQLPQGIESISLIPTADGSLKFIVNANKATNAIEIDAKLGDISSRADKQLSLVLTPPMGSNLRSIYSQNINATNKTSFEVLDSFSMDGHQIMGAETVEAQTVNTNCVLMGSKNICSSASGLQVETDIASLSNNLGVSEGITSRLVNALNLLKANKITVEDLKADDATLEELITTSASLTDADINLLSATSATLQSTTSKTLKAAGLTELANLVSNTGSFQKITGKDLVVSNTALMKALVANQIEVNNGYLSYAEVSDLVGTLATFQNFTSNFIQLNKLIASDAQLNQLAARSADLNSVVISSGQATSIDTNTLKGKLFDVSIATISKSIAAERLTTKDTQADVANFGVLNVTSVLTTKQLNATNLVASNSVSTSNLQVNDSATVDGNLNVGGTVTANTFTTNLLNVTNLVTALRLVVNSDLTVASLLKTSGLQVTNNVAAGTFQVGGALTGQNGTVSQKVSSGSTQVNQNFTTNTLTVGGKTSAVSANVSGTTTAGTANSSSGQFGSGTANTVSVTQKTTAANLQVSNVATLKSASFQNLTALVSQLGTISANSLSLNGQLKAASAQFASANTTGKGTFGTIQSNGTMLVRGSLSAVNDVSTTKNVTLSGALASTSANIGTISSTTLSAMNGVVGQTVRTSAGVDLAATNTVYINQDGRIVDLEKFKQECIANWTYACKGTVPAMTTACTNCTALQTSSGTFTGTLSASIKDCPAGCNYAFTVGADIAKSLCTDGAVSDGATKNVTCTFRSSPNVTPGSTLSSQVSVKVSHADRSSLAVASTWPIRWTYSSLPPVISSPSCPDCTRTQKGSGYFTASATASVTQCLSGCTYSWSFGTGVTKDVCVNGTIPPGSSKSVTCKIRTSMNVAEGTVRNSFVKLLVSNTANSSSTDQFSIPVRWEHEKSVQATIDLIDKNVSDLQMLDPAIATVPYIHSGVIKDAPATDYEVMASTVTIAARRGDAGSTSYTLSVSPGVWYQADKAFSLTARAKSPTIYGRANMIRVTTTISIRKKGTTTVLATAVYSAMASAENT